MSNEKSPTSLRGKIFVISGPSGAGKTTICKTMLQTIPNLLWSVSVTTREKREGETDGQDYHFISLEEFQKKLANHEFLEYAKVHDHYYGTLKAPIEKALAIGHHYLVEIDVQGARNVQKAYPNNSILIFITAPSFEVLRQRLLDRKQDSLEVIERRIHNAKKELEQATFYNYTIANVVLEDTLAQVSSIMLRAIEEQ